MSRRYKQRTKRTGTMADDDKQRTRMSHHCTGFIALQKADYRGTPAHRASATMPSISFSRACPCTRHPPITDLDCSTIVLELFPECNPEKTMNTHLTHPHEAQEPCTIASTIGQSVIPTFPDTHVFHCLLFKLFVTKLLLFEGNKIRTYICTRCRTVRSVIQEHT